MLLLLLLLLLVPGRQPAAKSKGRANVMTELRTATERLSTTRQQAASVQAVLLCMLLLRDDPQPDGSADCTAHNDTAQQHAAPLRPLLGLLLLCQAQHFPFHPLQ
jgi:hypothetical protein